MSRKKKLTKEKPLLIKNEVDLAQQQALLETGKMVTVNADLESRVVVETLPSIHGMINNSYAVISAETDRLAGRARVRGLDANEVRTFERLTASLVRLATLELNIKEQAELDVMSDEKIKEMALAALEKERKKGE